MISQYTMSKIMGSPKGKILLVAVLYDDAMIVAVAAQCSYRPRQQATTQLT